MIISKKERELVAVIAVGGYGFFINTDNGIYYICRGKVHKEKTAETLEELLDQCEDRTPVYSGEEVKIKF